MADQKVEPALTEEEWRVEWFRRHGDGEGEAALTEKYVDVIAPSVRGTGRHALAALCLHDQPFGFTWEDVDRLRERAVVLPEGHEWVVQGDDPGVDLEETKLLDDLADRIAALLPPREGS